MVLLQNGKIVAGMATGKIAAVWLALMIAAGTLIAAPAYAAGPQSVADLAEGLLASVVNISTSQNVTNRRPNVPTPRVPEGSPFQEFFDDLFPNLPEGNRPPRSRQSLGSGFVIDPEGIIVTNNHVISDADQVIVNFADGSRLEAQVIGRDSKTDIAVLRVETDEPLRAVSFGDSDSARIGDWVMAIGNPFGLGGTVTLGIVSAIGRDINSGPYDNFIQTDASINRGNSGGPLFNMDGQVIGINTAIISPSGGSIGIGFSIPASLATSVIDQLVEFGETRRGWLGVQIQTVTEEIAETLGMSEPMGALVGDVIADGPAADAKIRPGDVILSFDGKDVTQMRDLPRIVADTPVGKQVDVVVLRRGEEQTLEVEVGRLEDGEQQLAALEPAESEEVETTQALGMTLAELNDDLREVENIDAAVTGVLITEVDVGSHAADKNIREGEVIVEIGQEAVSTPADVLKRLSELKGEDRKNALLMISTRTGDIRFVVVRIEG